MLQDVQHLRLGLHAVVLRHGDGVVLPVELVAVIDFVHVGRNGNQGFPAVVHQRHRAHGIKVGAHDHIRLDAFPAQACLPGLKGHRHRIQAVRPPGLVVLAVVVNTQGFLKYSQIFEGNIADCATLSKIIEDLSERTSSTKRKPTVVLDAGIATEENLTLLKEKGFNYMCVSRSGQKDYTVAPNSAPVTVKDNKGQAITLQKVIVAGSTDNWLLVHSPAKELKEAAMSSSSQQRFEQGLEQVKLGIAKKSGTKKQEKVWERIGRLKERYPSIQQQYKITTDTDEKGIVTAVKWERTTVENKDGYYLLRTCLDEQDEAVQWEIYNTIREIEATFRVLKTDLDLRPIYHKNDEAAMAHLHLGLLAYWVVNTIRYQLKQKGINHQWKEIVRTMNTQKMGTVKMENEDEQEIIIRRCTEPIAKVKEIYSALKYKERPFCQRKFVVPLTKLKNYVNPVNTQFCSG